MISRIKSIRITALLLSLAVFAISDTYAQDDASSNETLPVTVENVDASGDAVHFSLRENRLIPADEVTSDNWDISFQGTTILVNNEAQMLHAAFEAVTEAPESGYRADDAVSGSAIPSGNGTGWFEYNPAVHVVATIPDRTIVVRTADDTYAKLEVLSYYEFQNPELGSPRFYTFRFVHQVNGSRDFQ